MTEQYRVLPAVRRRLLLCVLACLAAVSLSGCYNEAKELQDGYYTAEAAEYDEHGWKEFLIIYVSENKIVTAEYDAKNPSGFIKSWDMDYMRTMNKVDGTYPNEYTRIYSEALLSRQNPDGVDVVTGATHSHTTFQLLAQAVIEQARTGDKGVARVEVS